MNHKIVCWEDYAIPVPLWASWMAMDKNGEWYIFSNKPKRSLFTWVMREGSGEVLPMVGITEVIMPQPGPWTDQLYWIGD